MLHRRYLYKFTKISVFQVNTQSCSKQMTMNLHFNTFPLNNIFLMFISIFFYFFHSCIFVDNFGISIVDRVDYTTHQDNPYNYNEVNNSYTYRNNGQHTEHPRRPFRHLENLICISETAPNVIEFLLVSADKLKRIQFGSTAWFNDTTVTNILERGALKHIEEIRILRSYELTMQAVNQLITECPHLTLLSEMDGWEGITEEELRRLRERIKTENLDLDTFSTWSVTTN